MLETTFDLLMAQVSFCPGQLDRINNFVAFDLSGDKRGVSLLIVDGCQRHIGPTIHRYNRTLHACPGSLGERTNLPLPRGLGWFTFAVMVAAAAGMFVTS